MQDIFATYKESFERCYPGKGVSFHQDDKSRDVPRYYVNVNGSNDGSRSLTIEEMREAVRLFSA